MLLTLLAWRPGAQPGRSPGRSRYWGTDLEDDRRLLEIEEAPVVEPEVAAVIAAKPRPIAMPTGALAALVPAPEPVGPSPEYLARIKREEEDEEDLELLLLA